jgi:predicted metal-dependent phosphoesterase TrpH
LNGFDGAVITDHDVVCDLRLFRDAKDLVIIPGIEITTDLGHLIAFNISTSIEAGQTVEKTVEEIHDAGGLTIAPHLGAFFKGTLGLPLSRNLDAIEVINSAMFPFYSSSQKSRDIASEYGLPQTGGSDAHFLNEVGIGYTLVESEREVEAVASALRKGNVKPCGGPLSWRMRGRRILARLTRS